MASKPDDLDAVRAIADTLAQFDSAEQERIIRWVRERVGLPLERATAAQLSSPKGSSALSGPPDEPSPSDDMSGGDIKSFMEQKKPSSDTEFAAAVAYYYRFEAPVPERRETIGKDELLEACRLVGRGRPARPAQTLVNAHGAGVLDKAERGQYRINTVGENLVALTLPSAEATPVARRKASGNKRPGGGATSKNRSKKPTAKKASRKAAAKSKKK